MPGSIYKVIGPFGKAYVGQTRDKVLKRWSGHISAAKSNQKYGCRILNNAIRKHGADAFDVYVLKEDIPDADLDEMEIEMIAKHKTQCPQGYNILLGGGVANVWKDPATRAWTLERLSTAQASTSTAVKRRKTREAQREERLKDMDTGEAQVKRHRARIRAVSHAKEAILRLKVGSERDPMQEVYDMHGTAKDDKVASAIQKRRDEKISNNARNRGRAKRALMLKTMSGSEARRMMMQARANALYVAKSRNPGKFDETVRLWEEEIKEWAYMWEG